MGAFDVFGTDNKEVDAHAFENTIIEGKATLAKLLPEEERDRLGKVLVRSWTLGEMIAGVANAELVTQKLPQKHSTFAII